MDKLVKIIMLIIALSAGFLWVSNSLVSCSEAKSTQNDALAIDGDSEELFEGDEIDYSTNSENDEPMKEAIVEEEQEQVSDEEVDFSKTPASNNKPSTQNTKTNVSKPNPVSKPVAANTGGSHMIIAGNYLLQSNADIMIKKLKGLGYSGAYIAVFDQSQYHTVIANTYNSYEKAANSAASLKRQGVDCYVKRKK